MTLKQNCRLWPDDQDALILRAALGDGDEALDAWRQWKQQADYGTVDFAQRRLVPLLYTNLRRLAASDRILADYRNETRMFWIKNQELFKFATDEIGRLEERNVDCLILKGVALSNIYYPSSGLRPMSDVDLLVNPTQAEAAVRHFLRRGWSTSDEFIISLDRLDQIIAVRNGLNLCDPENGKEIDLHWRLLKSSLADSEPMWRAAGTFTLNGRALQTLCTTDQLLHACAQAADWNIVRPIRWIPDAMMVLSGGSIDWGRLVEQSIRLEIAGGVRDALCVLRDFLQLEIPSDAIERLQASRPTRLVSLDYRVSATAPPPIIGKPLHRYLRYLRIGKPQGLRFSRYLCYLWGAKSIPHALVYGLRLLFRDVVSGNDP